MSGAIPLAEAAALQAAMIAGAAPPEQWLELRTFRDGPRGSEWFGVRDYRAAARRAIELAATREVFIGAAPRVRQRGTADDVERAWALWADCDSPESVEALRRFRPLANIVNRTGTPGRLHAWWQIPAGMTPAEAARANRRLRLALGSDNVCDAPRIMRLAGTVNRKTDPPRTVECARLECDAYRLRDIVGRLPDDPIYTPKPARPRPVAAPSSSVLAGILRTVAQAQPGNRNAALFWGACRLAEHGLEGETTALHGAALAAGLSERETARTIASALRDQKVAA